MSADPASALYPMGSYAFPCSVLDTGAGGCHPGPFEPLIPDTEFQLVGSLAGGNWSAFIGAALVLFAWDAVAGNYKVYIVNGVYAGNGVAIWNAALGEFVASWSHACFGGGTRAYTVFVRPQYFASFSPVRAYLDERTQSSSELLRWNQPFEELPLCKRVRTSRGTAVWSEHVRGNMLKLGTCGLPRAGGQLIRLDF